jgi:predicted alpha/beta-hydrolase family hydrolase
VSAKPVSGIVALASGGKVTTLRYAAKARRARLVLAHGAGADQTHAFMVATAKALAERGIEVTTFNFEYTEKGRKAPDPAGTLEACFRDVVTAIQRKAKAPHLFLGGKSMGGRIASQMMAKDMVPNAPVRGLVFLGYPLHPPGRLDRLRVDHFPDVRVPQLFVQGERDAFGTPAELRKVIRRMGAPSSIHVIEDGDHSFAVPKKLKRLPGEIMAEATNAIITFIDSII